MPESGRRSDRLGEDMARYGSALTVLCLACGLLSSGCEAQARRNSTRISLTSKPVPQALAELARKSGVNILYVPSAVGRSVAPAVNEAVNAADAARQILHGLPLEVIEQGRDTLIIRRRSVPLQEARPLLPAPPSRERQTAAQSPADVRSAAVDKPHIELNLAGRERGGFISPLPRNPRQCSRSTKATCRPHYSVRPASDGIA